MTTPQGNGPSRTSPMKRYGPLIAVVVVVAVIALAVTLAGRKDNSTASGGTPTTGGSSGTGGTGGSTPGNGDAPITYAQAKAQGKEGSITWQDNCDTSTGRIKVPSVYAPPCLPKVEGDNGGATRDGVTADKITIVNYVPPDNNDLLAQFTANLDPKDKVAETTQKYVEMFNKIYNTYGRKVEVVNFEAKGAPDDAVAAQAEAIQVAETYHPFASLGGPLLTSAYAEEVIRRGIICIGCGASLPDQFYQDHAPYVWGPQATPEEFLVNVGDFITNRVNGRKAEFAGDEYKDQTRKFGVVHFEQNPPVFTSLTEAVQKCGADRGFKADITETYEFDIARMAERSTTIIGKLKAEGITTVVFLGDPVMPIFLTNEATKQNYFPEWIFTGTVLTDTTVLGRKYNKDQMKHAFGLSSLAVRVPQDQTDPWRLHQWFFGTPPAANNTNAIIYTPLQQIFLGIHMAGPKLTEQTFKQGMFNYPESGGSAVSPHVSYGDHGYFKMLNADTCTQTDPRTDYLGSDDMAEIWWDSTATGPDEQQKSDVPGMWRYANNGKRYLPGQIPNTPTDAFKMENTVTVFEKVDPSMAAPDYPPPSR